MSIIASSFGAPVEDWRAEWIWDGGDPAPLDYYLYARKTFDLESLPRSAFLHISADSRYKLYINGEYLNRGPARSDPKWQQYDSYDVREYLQSGPNVITVLVHHYGVGTGFSVVTRAGLICQLEMKDPTGEKCVIGTDESWRVRRAVAWAQSGESSAILGFPEIFNFNMVPQGWKTAGFDDDEWERAHVVPLPERPWTLIPREIPMLVEQEVYPERIHRIGQILQIAGQGMRNIGDIVSREVLEEPTHISLENPNHLLKKDGLYTLIQNSSYADDTPNLDGVRIASVIIDLGRIVNGFVRLKLDGFAGQVVDVTCADRLISNQVPGVLRFVKKTDRLILRNGPQEWESFEYKAARYIQLTFRNLYRPLKVESVTVNTWSYPAEVTGSFESSDPMLNWLWEACTRTTQLSMDDGYMDNSYREKSQWFGDVSTVLLGTYAAMGDLPLTHKYFRDAGRGQFRDGMLRMGWPANDEPLTPGVRNLTLTIPQHALVWALRVKEHYELYGEQDFVEEMYPVLKELMGWCNRHADQHGLLDDLPYWNWLDWSNLDLRGASFATNAIYLKNLRDMAYLAGVLKREKDRQKWKEKAEKVADSLRNLFWSEEEGLYWDSLLDGKASGRLSEHSNYLALLYGLGGETRSTRILEALLSSDPRIARISPNFLLYLQYALAKEDKVLDLLTILRNRFRMMYESGSQTVWEHWTYNARLTPLNSSSSPGSSVGGSEIPYPEGRIAEDFWMGIDRSLAQGACVSPSFIFSTEILGIQPVEPGFRRLRIEPKPGDLEWAKGKLPTPRGLIAVDWRRTKTEFHLSVQNPEEVPAEILLPLSAGKVTSLSVNGQSQRLDSLEIKDKKPVLRSSAANIEILVKTTGL